MQNLLIVVASYVFYGWWDWRFLGLIVFSTILDYSIGRLLKNEANEFIRKSLLWISVMVNLGFLGIFKYYNFFIDNFIVAFSFFGFTIKANSIDIILPVGISFYTFQTMSYTIDVYRKKLEPEVDLIAFSAFVCFFPQLVAGPIERATHLLPQFSKRRVFQYDKAVDGMRQILWGLFKKVVVADSCAEYANLIFNDFQDYNSVTLFLGALFFSFQIYGDFSGYSDIAIGTSKLFGFNLMKNFATPYFSRDISEFWRRWHISLSTWFRDYLYIPLGGSRGGIWMKVRNTFIIFLVSGFWHGASWTFIVWGGLNALYFLPLLLLRQNRVYLDVVGQGQRLPTFRELVGITMTFFQTVVAWVFFRSDDVVSGWSYVKSMLGLSGGKSMLIIDLPLILATGYVFSLLIIEWRNREETHGLSKVPTLAFIRNVLYLGLAFLILLNSGSEQEFIYFQF